MGQLRASAVLRTRMQFESLTDSGAIAQGASLRAQCTILRMIPPADFTCLSTMIHGFVPQFACNANHPSDGMMVTCIRLKTLTSHKTGPISLPSDTAARPSPGELFLRQPVLSFSVRKYVDRCMYHISVKKLPPGESIAERGTQDGRPRLS